MRFRHTSQRGTRTRSYPAAVALALGLSGLAGCADWSDRSFLPDRPGETGVADVAATRPKAERSDRTAASRGGSEMIGKVPGSASTVPPQEAQIVLGTGTFANLPRLKKRLASTIPPGDPVTLDFEQVEVRDVLRTVLGELLKQSYTVEPGVEGTVTLKTGKAIARDDVLPVLADALQLAGVALIERDGIFLALPADKATQQATLGGAAGIVTRIVPIRYVAIPDLETVLQPLTPAGTTIQADPTRRLLIMTGPAQELAQVQEYISIFDADFMQGMSFAIVPVRYGRARDIAVEANAMLATVNPSAKDVVRVMPLGRLNSILVASWQPAYIRSVYDWVERLDKGDEGSEPRIYVYRVRNGQATELGRVLSEALGISGGSSGGTGSSSPGFGIGGLAGRGGLGDSYDRGIVGDGIDPVPAGSPVASSDLAAPALPESPLAAGSTATPPQEGRPEDVIRLSVDRANNALVIVANPQIYAEIESALEKLDVPPLQVLIEATIAEVTLNDNFALGLQYAFQSGNFSAILAPNVKATSTDTTSSGSGAGAIPGFPGLGYVQGTNVLYSTTGANVLLSALAEKTNVRVLSSPNLMILNNGMAHLQVGSDVPTVTQTSTSNLSPNAPTVNSVNYRGTGIMLQVRPRVSDDGLVIMDIKEEISQPVTTTTSTLDSPTIQQRQVTSSVAVRDGETIALAGLIEERTGRNNGGVPWLKDIPGLGLLFGTRAETRERTELLVLITPQVVRTGIESEAVTQELRERLQQLKPILGYM